MLELKDTRKSYHSQAVLRKTSLELPKGIYWVKGANGSGKTTLLKMIAGLLPFEGDIVFNKISQKIHPVVYRQNVSWAGAEPLYPDFITGTELLMLYRSIRKVQQKEIDRLLVLFDMTGYINSPIGIYSAGMIKKLSLVLAFMGNPPLCVLDEPLITLDADALDSVCDYIAERYDKNQTTFLMSSHQDLQTQLMKSGKEIFIRNQCIFQSE
jgi:ABC-2 type transport system ATP-binding protein